MTTPCENLPCASCWKMANCSELPATEIKVSWLQLFFEGEVKECIEGNDDLTATAFIMQAIRAGCNDGMVRDLILLAIGTARDAGPVMVGDDIAI